MVSAEIKLFEEPTMPGPSLSIAKVKVFSNLHFIVEQKVHIPTSMDRYSNWCYSTSFQKPFCPFQFVYCLEWCFATETFTVQSNKKDRLKYIESPHENSIKTGAWQYLYKSQERIFVFCRTTWENTDVFCLCEILFP